MRVVRRRWLSPGTAQEPTLTAARKTQLYDSIRHRRYSHGSDAASRRCSKPCPAQMLMHVLQPSLPNSKQMQRDQRHGRRIRYSLISRASEAAQGRSRRHGSQQDQPSRSCQRSSSLPPLPLWCCHRFPVFSLPYPLPLWTPSLVFVDHRRHCSAPFPCHPAFWRPRCPPCQGGGDALFIRLLYHASLWAVLCVKPVLHTGYDVMAKGLTCSHERVQYYCCVVVGTLSWPWLSVGRLRDTVPVRCGFCVHGDEVPADVYGASDGWCTGL